MWRRLERETGIEPATNSLEGCDSTTELLPPPRLARLSLTRRYGGQARRELLTTPQHRRAFHRALCHCGAARSAACRRTTAPPNRSSLSSHRVRGWWGGEGSNLRSPKAAGLQPAAIDRSATSPKLFSAVRVWSRCVRRVLKTLFVAMISGINSGRGSCRWSWRRDLNPRPADYKSAALPD